MFFYLVWMATKYISGSNEVETMDNASMGSGDYNSDGGKFTLVIYVRLDISVQMYL